MIRTILVDDDPIARKSLEKLCKNVAEITVDGIFESAQEALDFLGSSTVDLMMLDIEMPETTGLELLESLSVMPQVIFTTSNRDYAYEAYEYDVTDFLKKPISQDRFQKSIEKAVEKFNALSRITDASMSNEIYVRADGKLIRVPFTSIHYFENVGDYVKVVTADGNHIIHATMKGVDSRLNHPRLIKVHRSYIINLDHVKDIEDNTVLLGKKVIPISRAHKSILLQRLNVL